MSLPVIGIFFGGKEMHGKRRYKELRSSLAPPWSSNLLTCCRPLVGALPPTPIVISAAILKVLGVVPIEPLKNNFP
eukprot:1836957-Pyramimonas_sp.AAC.1